MKEYKFYGWENSQNIHALNDDFKGINTPCDLYDALLNVWCEYSCTSRLRSKWSEENITVGQCSITAFLAQDIFGGDVYGILMPAGNFHCFNVVDGKIFDLTSEQFQGEKLDYTPKYKQSREKHFANDEKRKRYEYLSEELMKFLARS